MFVIPRLKTFQRVFTNKTLHFVTFGVLLGNYFANKIVLRLNHIITPNYLNFSIHKEIHARKIKISEQNTYYGCAVT